MKTIILLLFTIALALSSTVIGLKQRNTEYLRELVLDISSPTSPNYGQYLNPRQINKIIGYDKEELQHIFDYLDSKNIHYRFYGDAIVCDVYDSYIEYFPEVEFVTSFQKFTFKKLKRTDIPSSGYVPREVIERLYNIPKGVDTLSKNISGGVIEYIGGQGFSQLNLLKNQRANNLNPNPVSTKHIIGTNNGIDGESELDIQYIGTITANATLWFEHVDMWMYEWALDFVNRQNIPHVISLSWGWSETQQCQIPPNGCGNLTSEQYVKRTNIEFMKIAARGVTMVVASGDAGSPGRTSEGCSNGINPVFPGSSEWVTSVGGTYVVSDNVKHSYKTDICKTLQCANGDREEQCWYNQTSWTSGAGFAKWTKTPQWQLENVREYLTKSNRLPPPFMYNPNGRGYPDVSAVGHNCAVYSYGGWGQADGTSCAAPLFAGIVMMMNNHQLSRNKPRLGFANPLLYKMYNENPNSFNDITEGYSGCTEEGCCERLGFYPEKGWDVVSGLGTPNVGVMIKMLKKLT